ncbi:MULTISPECIES: carbohydrate ABC transporter permease [unclassified Paenibacillus]|uniref:carbohydrate ABC transporter permease n=1 Tax=unclassified Paenibacillus TaxID=185978 RepID=UPI001C10425C|nr:MULTISPECIES: carbohydrate ABC transporter permease [unclassified Paenibacillus]MBU5444926.1 carbohydrate ABC transporter permease [Paenibacillus sp. MSJ-34]CAH0120671.1 L-arabinose transport system permease protein AraQ [Paenibacillus sp. CECT 9249]
MNQGLLRAAKLLVMAVLAFVALLPIVWMILGSFRSHEEIFRYSSELEWRTLIPVQWTLDNYRAIFTDAVKPFGRFIANTLTVAAPVTLLSLFFNSLAAFAFAKMKFRFKKIIFAVFLSALVIPGEVTLVPTYLTVNRFGWIDTYTALIVPAIVSVFSVFLLVQFFSDIPRELLEAGRIDGASWFGIYRQIVLPASVPALVTLAIITFLGQWDSYLWPLVVINDQDKQMLQVAIAAFSNAQVTEWGRILAADTVSSIPILILFVFLQKYYVRGITMSGIKG